jgi:predicted AlkP superfamily phosphohydrolase/phosphomutase
LKRTLAICLVLTALAATCGDVHAYVGPGAGFAFLTSFAVLFLTIFVALGTILIWPIRYFILKAKRRGMKAAQVDRVVVIGFDGMDPKLTRRFMDAGKLPNLKKLADEGTFRPLKTTSPSISPAAWSSFLTGSHPAKHNVFDFLAPDRRTYFPVLSSADIGAASRTMNLGKYAIPLSKPKIRLLRRGVPFWKHLGDRGIFSSVIRVPITFPPEEFRGNLIGGLCVPDLKGTQGTFSYYTTSTNGDKHTGGEQITVTMEGDTIHTEIEGPVNSMLQEPVPMKIPFTVKVDRARKKARIEIQGETFELGEKEYSPWVRLVFGASFGIKVQGITRFYVTQMEPEFGLYVMPVHIDPEKPALPISHPFVYAVYLSKLIGPYATLGLAEDTWALNERIIDEGAFLDQAYSCHEEREKMLFNELEKVRKGLVICVFDTTDRVQHMMYRYLVPGHPASEGQDTEVHKNSIEDLYVRMDEVVGRVREKMGERETLIVMSDHGFKSFHRGVNLNSWLLKNGYMTLKEGCTESREWMQDVDWSKTRVYALGLGGIYINVEGREGQGIVKRGEELENLKRELKEKLEGFKDTDTGDTAIRNVYVATEVYKGPYVDNAPDLVIGYSNGYRASWDCATGIVNDIVFEDNKKAWSGDHCLDPVIVPGIFFSNRKINTNRPRIIDIAPTVLELFGAEVPPYMDGHSLLNGSGGSPREEPKVAEMAEVSEA